MAGMYMPGNSLLGHVEVPVTVDAEAGLPQMPSLAALAAAGVARVSWGPFLFLDAMARFSEQLASLQE